MTLIKNLVFTIIFLLYICCNIYATEKIGNIKIIGNQRVANDTILFYSELKPGDDITREGIDRSIKHLYGTGFFSKISITKDQKNTLLIEVKENPIIRKLTIKGSKKLKSNDVKNDLLTRQGNVYSRFQIETDVRRITALYKKMGYYSANVDYSVQKLGENAVDISIVIDEGNKPTIRKITFLGNKRYSQKTLSGIIASKEKAWYRFFSSSDLYDQDKISLDKELLRNYYMQEGYADFKVLSSASEITPNGDSFLITYLIHEGDKFSFGNTTVSSKIEEVKNLNFSKFIQ